ncbi:MBL fold metallo-hydrolase [Candidatus Aerophobetes bacterium]|uniref:MBL fold metallo-hydrolase n=1 Tax=Aerophobetes bacterium TaxID=2030807 RepID=A0A662D3I7_UNCAE|nr:MAG: MBL fold metallo-hydrolase [Candidatus Aerophobetes bacterium]
MKVTIIYDNTVYQKGLLSDWGFSCFVEVENTPKILFDTGTNGKILLSNMRKLNIDPASIDEVFISHAHFDHVGGLSSFLEVNKKAKIYVPPSFPGPAGREVITIKGSTRIHENVFSTGELDNIEQSMPVKTEKGLVLIVGCSHPRMTHILKAASQFGKVYAIIGGLHGFSEFDLFKDLSLICPTHCTQHKAKIKSLYPDKYVEGGAGKIITV